MILDMQKPFPTFVPFGILRFQCLSLQGSLFATNFVMPRPGGFSFFVALISHCTVRIDSHTHAHVQLLPRSLLVAYGS